MTDRCASCDGYGWEKDPDNRYGPEIPCAACGGSGHETRAAWFGCETCAYLRQHSVPRRTLLLHHLRHHRKAKR